MDTVVSRRTLLAGGAALALVAGTGGGIGTVARDAVAAEAGAGMADLAEGRSYDYYLPKEGQVAFESTPIPPSAVEEHIDADVVVCGAGLAGVIMTLAAVDRGFKTVLLEKTDVMNVRGSGIGSLSCAVAQEAGVVFDETQYFNDALKAANFRCDVNVWKAWVAHNGEAVDWLIEQTKDSITPYINLPETGSAADTFAGVTTYNDTIEAKEGMWAWADAALARAIEKGADVRFATPAVQLVRDGDGPVTGVIAKREDGSYAEYTAGRGVVLCTGGYENNWDMLQRYMRPEDLNVVAWRLPNTQNTGDGHLMGMQVGGALEPAPHVMMRDPGGSAAAHASMTFCSCRWPRVNKNGERFCNEVISHNNLANAIMRQPGGRDFIILAGPTIEEAMAATTYRNHTPGARKRTIEDIVAQVDPVLMRADTLDELAEQAGIDPEGLKRTCARLTELFELGEDVDYGTDPGMLMSYEYGPYYCVEEGCSDLVTVSGLQTNAQSEVLGLDGEAIPGLYAIGNCAGGMFHDTYPHELSGISHSRCVVFPYMLAKHLAGEV